MTTMTRKRSNHIHQQRVAAPSSRSLQQRVEHLEAEIAFLRTIISRERAYVPAWAREPEEAISFSVSGEPLPR